MNSTTLSNLEFDIKQIDDALANFVKLRRNEDLIIVSLYIESAASNCKKLQEEVS